MRQSVAADQVPHRSLILLINDKNGRLLQVNGYVTHRKQQKS